MKLVVHIRDGEIEAILGDGSVTDLASVEIGVVTENVPLHCPHCTVEVDKPARGLARRHTVTPEPDVVSHVFHRIECLETGHGGITL